MNIRFIIGALMLLAGGIVSANPIADGVTKVHGGADALSNITEGGDLFLVVLDQTTGYTYVQNLDTDFVAFKNGGAQNAAQFPLDSSGTTFLGSAGDTYVWAVLAGNGLRDIAAGNNVADWGILTTAGVNGTAGRFSQTFTGPEIDSTVVTYLGQGFINAANAALNDTTNSATYSPGDNADWSKQSGKLSLAPIYGDNITDAPLGQSQPLYYLSWDYFAGGGAGAPVVTQLGSFTLTTGGLAFAPPGGGNTPNPVLDPISDFADQAVGTTSAPKLVTLRNTGTAAYQIQSVSAAGAAVAGEFALTANNNTCVTGGTGIALAAGASCTFEVVFAPTASGARSGTLTVHPATGTDLTADLHGAGTAAGPDVAFDAISDFAAQAVGTTSAAKVITLRNNGTAGFQIQSITVAGDAVAGDFSLSSSNNTCLTGGTGITLAAGANCSFEVVFAPSAAGARHGTITVHPTTGSDETAALHGTGTAAAPDVALDPISDFSDQAVGSTSQPKVVTLRNNGTAGYEIQSVSAAGTAVAGEFAVTASNNTCLSSGVGITLAAGANCSFEVVFAPTATGARSGTLTIHPKTGADTTADLKGTATAAAPDVVFEGISNFADQVVSTRSAPKLVTLKNNGTAGFEIDTIAVAGSAVATEFAITGNDNSCISGGTGITLAANATCSFQVVFAPADTGTRNGTITVHPKTGADKTATLSGTGITGGHLVATPATVHFGAIRKNKTAKLSVTLRNDGTEAVTIGGISDPETPFKKLRNSCSSSRPLQPGKSCVVSFQFAPQSEDSFNGSSIVSASGLEDITLSLSGTVADQPGSLLVDDPSPTTDIGLGDTFTLSGQEFTSLPGKVLVGGKAARIKSWTDDLIVAIAPKSLEKGSQSVKVIRNRKFPASGETAITVHAPEFASLPTGGTRGSTITALGQYFGAGKPKASFRPEGGGRAVAAKVLKGNTGLSLQLVVPARLPLGAYTVVLSNRAGESEALPFTVSAN